MGGHVSWRERSLATASCSFASIAGVIARQPHALACARCHRKRCVAVGRGGMRCFLCHVALIMLAGICRLLSGAPAIRHTHRVSGDSGNLSAVSGQTGRRVRITFTRMRVVRTQCLPCGELRSMCRRVTCTNCGKPTFAGCGRHVEEVLRDVPANARCTCRETASLKSSASRRPWWKIW